MIFYDITGKQRKIGKRDLYQPAHPPYCHAWILVNLNHKMNAHKSDVCDGKRDGTEIKQIIYTSG